MRISKVIAVGMFLLCGVSIRSFAQIDLTPPKYLKDVSVTPLPSESGPVLSVDEALSLGRTNNRDLNSARERLKGSHADVEMARSTLLPKLTAQGRYTYNYPSAVFS